MPMLPLMGVNHRLPLFHMAKHFIWVEEKSINEFAIGYMINTDLIVRKSFRYQVENVCTLHLVKSHNLLLKPHCQKRKTSVLSLIIFYETRADNPAKVSEC